jgi:hypothetical protein
MNALTLEWEAAATQKLSSLLQYLDAQYPGRIGGVFPCFLHTSEWFMPGPQDFGGDTHLSDYSNATEKRYCATKHRRQQQQRWNQTRAGGDDNGQCQLPPPSQRARPVLGTAYADTETAGLNLFLAGTVVHAIEALAAAAKSVSKGNLMTFSFYGYLLALADNRLAGSGHLALGQLLKSKNLDAIASPYMYGDLARDPASGALLVHGPWDSLPLHNKTWVTEDDSDTFKHTATLAADLLKRNVLTSVMHGAAHYLYDLGQNGAFGKPDAKNDSDTLWGGVKSALRIYNSTTTSAPAGLVLRPEIAIFVDEDSAAVRTVFDDGAPFLTALIRLPPQYLAASGAPVRIFLLSDLLLPDVDWEPYKMCVFLNAFVVSPAIRAAIESKLKHKSVPTTLVFTFGAGLFDDAMAPRTVNITAVSTLVGVPLRQGAGAANLNTYTPNMGPHLLGTYGVPGQQSPWFQLDDNTTIAAKLWPHDPPIIEQLGFRTAQSNATVLVRAHHRDAGWSSVFSASPGMPLPLWLSLAAEAGVHMYLDDLDKPCSSSQVGDAVEVRGRTLVLHASAACMHTGGPAATDAPRDACVPPGAGRAACGHPPYQPSDGCTVAMGCCFDTNRLAETELNWCYQPPSNSSCADKCHVLVPTPSPWPPPPPGPLLKTSRTVLLPFAATVRDEAGVLVCEGCTRFATAALRAGQVQVFQLS